MSGNFSVAVIPASEGTLEAMRHYTVKMMNSFSTFKCLLCKYSVTTREFNSQNGNCRTQAARVMNDHAIAVHGGPRPTSLYDAQPWHVR